MAKGWRKISRKKLLEAIEKCSGIKVLVAKKLGVNRSTVERYAAEDEDVRAAFDQENESLVDIAEAVIRKKMQDGSLPAAMFVADRKGRHRGWGKEPPPQQLANDKPNIVDFEGVEPPPS